jgi:hypothetical protein
MTAVKAKTEKDAIEIMKSFHGVSVAIISRDSDTNEHIVVTADNSRIISTIIKSYPDYDASFCSINDNSEYRLYLCPKRRERV